MNIKSVIKKYKRISLSFFPTPLEYLKNLSKKYKGPNIFIKRDDYGSLAFGGNKIRKLEFILADAISNDSEVIITIGGIQSNWVRQTVSAARKIGLDIIVLLEGNEPKQYQGNILLDKIMRAKLKFIGKISQEDEDKEIRGNGPFTNKIAKEEIKKGRKPFIAPLGGSVPLGNLGYINAVQELYLQCKEKGIKPDKIILATGSGGTQAGVELGIKLLKLETKVIGMSISRHIREKSEEIAKLCNETLNYLSINSITFNQKQININYDYVGKGYAIPTKEGIDAIYEIASNEGIILDPVYTGKAMAGLLDFVKKGKFKKEENIIFLHTGGASANFAYSKFFK